MLAYDWMWWGQLTNQNLAHRGARRGTRRCKEGCTEVRGDAQRGAQRFFKEVVGKTIRILC